MQQVPVHPCRVIHTRPIGDRRYYIFLADISGLYIHPRQINTDGKSVSIFHLSQVPRSHLAAVLNFHSVIQLPKTINMASQVSSLPLKGKVAIVTGASRGLGASMAYELAARGANVSSSILIHRATTDGKLGHNRLHLRTKWPSSRRSDLQNYLPRT